MPGLRIKNQASLPLTVLKTWIQPFTIGLNSTIVPELFCSFGSELRRRRGCGRLERLYVLYYPWPKETAPLTFLWGEMSVRDFDSVLNVYVERRPLRLRYLCVTRCLTNHDFHPKWIQSCQPKFCLAEKKGAVSFAHDSTTLFRAASTMLT